MIPGTRHQITLGAQIVTVLLFTLLAAGAAEQKKPRSALLADRPLALWDFKTRSVADQGPLLDSNGAYRADIHGAVDFGAPGHPVHGAAFDGTTGFLELADTNLFSGGNLSIEFWFCSTQRWDRAQWPGSAALLSKALPGPGSGDWTINGGSSEVGRDEGRIFVNCGPAGSGRDLQLSSGEGLNDGAWHHVVWTRSDAGANCLYIDGGLADEGDDGGGSILNSRPVQVGGDPHQKAPFFHGTLDVLAIYTNVLSPERVRAHIGAGGGWPGPREGMPAVKPPLQTLRLQNTSGLTWEFGRETNGWTLGRLELHSKPVEIPARRGLIALRHRSTGEMRWLAGATARQTSPSTVTFTGTNQLEGAAFSFELTISLMETGAGVSIEPSWQVDREVAGWEVCLAYHDAFSRDWRVQSYPFAGNSPDAHLVPMRYCGVPGALIYRPDLSLVLLYAIDSRFDYLNPTTWTGKTEFHFDSRRTAPQFRVGGGSLLPGTRYTHPLQLFVSDAGNSADAITALVKDWIRANDYTVKTLPLERSPDAALALYMEGRRHSRSWVEGIGYEHSLFPDGHGSGFVHLCNVSYSAFLEYRLFEMTGEKLWRDRALAQINTVLRAQQTNAALADFGAIHDNYQLREDRGHAPGTFHSQDWALDGYKVDVMAHIVRYLLLSWEAVKRHEGIDHGEWRQAAERCGEWILRQQNPDGGLPQNVDVRTGARSVSVVSHRALAAMPYIAKVTGDTRYDKLAADLENFLRTRVEGRFWFTGSHPDLPPNDFEQDSVWGAVEYWLNKHDRTGDPEALRRAAADVYFVLLYWCPKQLSWVKRPTQGAHSEQQHFNQYSVYCFQNRKVECLDRLSKKTGDPLFAQLRDRVIALNIKTQMAQPGPWQGGFSEAIADPWLERNAGFEWVGSTYTSELCTDFFLQLVEMGLAKPRPQ